MIAWDDQGPPPVAFTSPTGGLRPSSWSSHYLQINSVQSIYLQFLTEKFIVAQSVLYKGTSSSERVPIYKVSVELNVRNLVQNISCEMNRNLHVRKV